MKRVVDIIFSLLGLMVASPILLIFIVAVWLQDFKSPFYIAPRAGKKMQIFHMVKLRSMVVNADKNGVDSTSADDMRITSVGNLIRKFKIDELSQLWNVLKGDMSIVGPRPERQYYIDKITEKAPHFLNLLKVKPGITSWGQVKFGYAENIEEMIQRLNYDIFYIENMSLYLDFKIMIHTILVILKRSGK